MFQLSKKRMFILLITWVVLLCMTTLFAFYINSKNNKSVNAKSKKIDYIGVNYYSFYDENDLKITEENFYDDTSLGYFSYIKIEGLKNKKIEKKINDEIYDYVKTAIENKKTFVQTSIMGNFSNILSILFYSSNESELKYDTYNYDLTTGSEIKFEDLFSNSANISSILYSGYYDAISISLSSQIQFLKNDIETCIEYKNCRKSIDELKKEKEEYELKLNSVEDIVQQKVREFIKSKDKKFYITNYGIVVIDENEFVTLKTKTNSNYFAYYEKYKTKNSIFDNNNGKKNLFMTSHGNEFVKYSRVEYIDDYALIDFQKEYELNEIQINYANKIIDKYIKNFNERKFTYLNVNGDLNEPSKGDYGDILGSIQLEIAKCEMDKNYFELTYKEKLFESKESAGQEFFGRVYYDDKNDTNFKCTQDTVSAIVDFEGNIYENVKDIFVDSFDYEDYLKKEFYNTMSDRSWAPVTYTEEEKKKHEFKYEIEYGSIKVSISREEYVQISLENIPREYIKLKF